MKTTIYITKYALTDGILVREGEPTHTEGGYFYKYTPESYLTSAIYGKDVYLALEPALKRAEEMRVKKIASLEKQIKKLQTLVVKVKQ